MSDQAQRVQRLVALAVELQHCGSRYLAALLVEEAYGRQCLENVAFATGSVDDAALQVDERLRRIALPAPAALESWAERRQRIRKERKGKS